MDIAIKMLDLLFCRIPPERLLKRLQRQSDSLLPAASVQDNLDVFLRFSETTLHGYSTDEQIQLFNHLKQVSEDTAGKIHSSTSVFMVLAEFGERVLNVGGNDPTCKFEQVLLWRDAFHLLGQDTIVCAYMAYHDILKRKNRLYFAWPAIIRTDYVQLESILRDGVAENHCHLNGSTQSFGVSWCKLMNYPELSNDWAEYIKVSLRLSAGRGTEDNVIPLDEKAILAATIRASLFTALMEYTGTPDTEDKSTEFLFKNGYCKSFRAEQWANNQAAGLRATYGANIPNPSGISERLDYALTEDVFLPVADSAYRLLSGERYFLYQCFRACFSGFFNEFERDMFYTYLLIKNAFRGEMIQVNKQVGFQNFSDYEKRKDVLYGDDNTYWWEAYRMALNAPLEQEYVTSFESRFCPSATAKALKNKVMKYDLAKWYADIPYSNLSLKADSDFQSVHHSGFLSDEPHFYVLHYPKRKDEVMKEPSKHPLVCRHARYRDYLKSATLAMDDGLAQSDYLCGRIRGIDACSNEVECRPEVFATAYRYMAKPYFIEHDSGFLQKPMRRISFTYHAGEDFYDIADGLRAIDETVYFLEFKRGSRIGHALALGVDPDIHYATKHRYIMLPKQNYLDNLVWLMYRGRELGVHIDSHQYGIMKETAQNLLREIYGNAITENNWSIDLSEYYCSMKLRGDNPALYITMKYQEPRAFSDEYDRCGISSTHSELAHRRRDARIAGLYYYYHYGAKEKAEGAKPASVAITPEYIKVVRDTQDKLQRELEEKGIIIECNPTSNVLIGTFSDYRKHPIFRFNDYGLAPRPTQKSTQMQVCVNTDDLGVFDTSIDFEYALLAKALEDLRDENGERLYSRVEIMQYLDNVRRMGLQAVFPKANKPRGVYKASMN